VPAFGAWIRVRPTTSAAPPKRRYHTVLLVGINPLEQGKGCGTRLMEEVHLFCKGNCASRGVCLDTATRGISPFTVRSAIAHTGISGWTMCISASWSGRGRPTVRSDSARRDLPAPFGARGSIADAETALRQRFEQTSSMTPRTRLRQTRTGTRVRDHGPGQDSFPPTDFNRRARSNGVAQTEGQSRQNGMTGSLS
jgi:hypothetical protein